MLKIQALKDEIVYQDQLNNGLNVAIHPKRDFHGIVVSFVVKFGGCDHIYQFGEVKKTLPAGVAHFLEHLMFSNQGINLPEAFASIGAEVNAFTSSSVTSYTFKTMNNIEILLDVFLNNFIEFNIEDQVIAKEHQIIKHELMMSDDSVHYDMHQAATKLLYDDYAITSDIGGSVSDIRKIDKQTLMMAFNDFYHPANCSLIITGNVDQDKLFALINNHPYNQKQWPDHQEIKQVIEYKEKRIHSKTKYVKDLPEPMSNFLVKIPEDLVLSKEREINNIALSAIVGNVFGLGSSTFDFLEKQNLMNVTFFTKLSMEKSYGYLKISIQSNKIKRYSKTMREIILDISRKPLDQELFTVNKKNIIGNYITLFDSLDRIHSLLSICVTEGIRIDDFLERILNMSVEDLEPYRAIFTEKNLYELTYLKRRKK